jgi:regulator of RNase E activity RraA
MDTSGTLDEALRAKLLAAAVPTLVSTLFRMGFANTFLRNPKALNPASPRMVGTAFTMRTIAMREDVREAIADGRMANLQARAFDRIGPGQVLVCGAEGMRETALLGDVISTSFLVHGVAGVVVDGSVSDGAAIGALDLPVYCLGDAALPFTSHRHVVELEVPISCDGVPVMPGDVLVGDANGVVCIPQDKAQEVAEIAAERELMETFVVERVRAGAPLAGTYPPDEATRRAYQAWLNARNAAARD